MIESLIFIVGVAVGFFVRHAYPAKFEKAEELADKAKSQWDDRKP